MNLNQDNFDDIKLKVEKMDPNFEVLSIIYKDIKDGNKIRKRKYAEIKHKICGKIFYKQTWMLDKKISCPKCVYKKKDKDTFYKEFYESANNDYELLSEYELVSKKVKVKHKKCGHIYEVSPNKWLNGRRCPNCFGPRKMTVEKFKELFYKTSNNEYELLSDYVNTHTKVKVKHKKCGHIYEVSPNKWLNGRRCPKCKQSKGERLIDVFLTSKGITFKRQVIFKECKDINPLPFDFAIYNKDKLLFLIEFDGSQHFQKRYDDIDGSKLRKTQEHDKIKNDYCKDNNIPLLRIKDTKLINISIEKMFNDYPEWE